MNAPTKKPFELTGRHVLMMLVAFFTFVFGVEAIFIATAISTHTGTVSKQPYAKGLKYGERIALAERQQQLGWKETLNVSQVDHTLTLSISDPYGKPVTGLHFGAMIGRGVTDAEDHRLVFHSTGAGTYTAKIPPDLAGTYIVDIEASNMSSGGDIVWRMRKRLWLQP